MKKKILTVILSVICVVCFSLFFMGCNNDNGDENSNNNEQIVAIYNTYVAYAEENGKTPLSYEDWLTSIKGEKGDKGDSGTNGQDGKTPTIEIIDGYWYINGENTGVKAEGKDGVNGTNGTNGKDGQDGTTPTIEIIDGYWYINGKNTGVKAEGKDGVNGTNGTNGVDGKTPTIEIIDGYWYINGDNTGVKAEGKDGINGINGKGIKNAVIDSNGDLIITFDDNTWVNAGSIVPKNPILDENNKIIFNNISIEDNNGFIKVENGTTTFSFLDEIEIRGNANYTVSTDITGLNEIPTKTVNLDIGDNVFYVLESCGNDANLYTITIRRDLHTVTFNTNGGTLVDPILVNTGEMITAPTSQRNGYGLSWEFDFETPITEDITINATWTAIFRLDTNNKIKGLTTYGETLEEIYIPSRIDEINIKELYQNAFHGNNLLMSVTISSGIVKLGGQAFCNCTSLRSVMFENNSQLEIMGSGIFSGCSALENISIPSNVTIIESYAFKGCTALKSIKIPNSVTSIGNSAFYNCTSIISIAVGENNQNYKSIDGNLYSKDGKTLVQYAIGKTITHFTIPEEVTSIGTLAFARCTTLTSVEIPDDVTYIGGAAFAGCTSLTDVYCYAQRRPASWDDLWLYTDTATVHWGYKGE